AIYQTPSPKFCFLECGLSTWQLILQILELRRITMEPGTSVVSNTSMIHLEQFTSQQQEDNQRHQQQDDKQEWRHPGEQQKQQLMQGGQQQQQHQREDCSNQQEKFEINQPQHIEQIQPHIDEQSVPGTSTESNLSIIHSHQFSSQVQGDNQRHQQQGYKHEQLQEGDQKKHHLMQGGQQWQQLQQEDHSNQQEQFEQKQPQYPERSLPHVAEQSEHLHLKTSQPQQQKQHKELEQEQHQHQQKQCLQQSLQTHRQPQQLHLQPQVQQQQHQQFNHQQPLQAASGGQKSSRLIHLSHVVQTILPGLPREQAERVSATLLRFQVVIHQGIYYRARCAIRCYQHHLPQHFVPRSRHHQKYGCLGRKIMRLLFLQSNYQ
ncbi:hypothetical protein KI387_018698, partial [Taxus chinensis]